MKAKIQEVQSLKQFRAVIKYCKLLNKNLTENLRIQLSFTLSMLVSSVAVPALTLVRHSYLAGQVVPVDLGLLWALPQGGPELQAIPAVLVAPEDP